MPKRKPGTPPPCPEPILPDVPPGPTVNMSVRVPVSLEIQIHGLARHLSCQKRVLVVKLLQAGLDRYAEGRRLKSVAVGLIGQTETAA